RDVITDPDVPLEEHGVARDIVLQQLLTTKGRHDRRDQKAEQRDVRVLGGPSEGEEYANHDDEGGDDAPGDDRQLAAPLPHPIRHEPRKQSSDEVGRGQKDDRDERVVDPVRDGDAPASDGGQRHSSLSAASSSAGASPSAPSSPSAGTAASAAGISSSTLSSRLCTILTTSSSDSSRMVTSFGTARSDTRSSMSISSSGVMSTSNDSGMSEGRHSTRIEYIACRTSASPRLTAADSPVRCTGTPTSICSWRSPW